MRLRASMGNIIISILSLFQDLATLVPSWIAENHFAIAADVDLWQCSFPTQELPSVINDAVQKYRLMLAIFTQALKESPRLDLGITFVYTFSLGSDLVSTSTLLYEHVALSNDSFFKRSVLNGFLTRFTSSTHSEMHTAHSLRHIASPMET
jgi:transformation/transcription domain-associated protein